MRQKYRHQRKHTPYATSTGVQIGLAYIPKRMEPQTPEEIWIQDVLLSPGRPLIHVDFKLMLAYAAIAVCLLVIVTTLLS